MTKPDDTIRVVIPLTIRKRNGRPKILPPKDVEDRQVRAQAPHILQALGRAWAWRRKLESGAAATVSDIAKLENVTDRFVSRTMRLAYLSPEVLDGLVLMREIPALPCNHLGDTASLPWAIQSQRVRTP